ncbi:LPS assembly protein LptD [Hyphomonas sp.]|uniref:LPS-assembly protein LptD n=1 Tax=Hyphomonas sp. TaxID=87 RepID=UPI000C694EAF|nr:LPS assembly protein LptD [Hyphomonas sp.]MAU66967.1 organic solvent tolerance protein [Hyphomonas sp.]
MANWYHYAAALALAASPSFGAVAQESSAPDATASSQQVVLEADYVYELRDENSIVAEGNVEALYDGRILRADRLVYNRTTERVRATGNVVIIDTDGSQQFSDEVEVGSNLSDGYAIGYSARLTDGSTIVANSAIRQPDGINAMDQVIYTACAICEAKGQTPTWSLRARRAVLDQETQMISYRDAVLEVMGIPVFYFPYLAHPDPTSDRRSGLMIPSAGFSSKLGAFYQQPYYWAISDSSDLTIAPLITENVNPMLELDYRKRFYSGAININTSITREKDFDSDGEKFGEEKWRGHLYGSGRFALTKEWQWGFGIETQTDDLYDRRYDIDGQGDKRGIYQSQPRRLLSQLYAVGQGDSYYTDVSLLSIQGLRGSDADGSLPTVTPLLFSEKYWDLGDYGFASVNASTAILRRDVGDDSQRVSVGADWSTYKILPGGFTFEPFAELRGDYYQLDQKRIEDDNASRLVGNAGARIAYPMIRPGKTVDIMLEPEVMAAWGTSNSNDPIIPNEDALLFEMDETVLFNANTVAGYDLYEGDGKISAGLTARAVWKDGPELSATVGRRWRSRPDPSFEKVTNLDGTTSDWVAAATADFGSALRIDTQVRLDEDGLELNRIDTRLSTQSSRWRATGQYYKISERLNPNQAEDEGFFMTGEFRITERYSFIYGQLRDIANNRNARKDFGIAYEDDCSRLELVYSRSELQDRTQGPSENIQIRFSLKTLGQFGSSEFD